MKLSPIINEAKYPADIDGITMKFLYVGINNAAKKINNTPKISFRGFLDKQSPI